MRIVKGTWALVPKGAFSSRVLYALCTHIYDSGREICELEDLGDHWLCPREVFTDQQIQAMNHQVLRLRPNYREAPMGSVEVSPEGAKTERQQRLQAQAYDILTHGHGGGVIELPPNTGKTALALMLAQHYAVPTLIVTHTKDLQEQWFDRCRELAGMELDQLGRIGGGKWDYHGKSVTIALVQSLTSRSGLTKHDLTGVFGLAVYDEVHHMQAARFRLALTASAGVRVGLSATVKNRGLEQIYLQHLGPVVFKSQETDLQPRIVIVNVDTQPSQRDMARIARGIRLDSDRGSSNLERVYTMEVASKNENLNAAIISRVNRCRQQGRTQIVLSDRKAQLHTIHQSVPGSALITGDVDPRDRKKALYKADVVVATTNLATEGLDRADLDTLHIALPWAGITRFVQGLGRILRNSDDKHPPVVYAYCPKGLPLLEGYFRGFQRNVRRYRYDTTTEET